MRLYKYINFLFRYGILAWMAAGLVWFFIIKTLRDGISCDEGYYLMGFLRGQNIDGQGSDFHSIARALCFAFPDDDIMVYRYMRLALNVIALILFAATSYRWLSKRHSFSASRWAYYPMVALAGAMSFTFAAPTLSYDNLEVIITLLSTSCLFVLLTVEKRWAQLLSALGVGFFQWFAFTNYPPAGLCLTLLLIAVYFIEKKGTIRFSLFTFHFSLFTCGIVLALILNHFLIHDLRLWGADFGNIFVSTFTEKSTSHHDSGSLISGMLMTIGKQALILIPIAALSTMFYSKVKVKEWMSWVLTIGICLFLLVYRKTYEFRGTLMLIPVAIMFGKILGLEIKKLSTYHQPPTSLSLFTFYFLLFIVLIAIPFAGVFGTNQVIMRKAIMFTPFWLLAFYYLTTFTSPLPERGSRRPGCGNDYHRLTILFLTLLFAGYFYLGNFQRYQYYYTPRSSKCELVGVARPQSIRVSHYQQAYYAEVIDSLRAAGCQPGDRYMAFEEDLMAVYLAGGYIEGCLPYHWWQYDPTSRPLLGGAGVGKEAPKAFILFKSEEESVLNHFKSAGWVFPHAYRRIEMRQAAENMGDDLRTVLYVRQP